MFDIKNLFDSVKKIFPFGNDKLGSKTLKMIDIIEEELNSVYLPTLELLNDNKNILKDLESHPNWKLIKEGLKVKSMQELMVKLNEYGDDINKNIDLLRKVVKANVHDVINEKTISLKQYSLYRLLEDTLGNLRFALRIQYFILKDPKNSILSKKFSNDIFGSLSKFRDDVLKRIDIRKVLDEIQSMPSDSLFDRYESGTPNAIATSGFNKYNKLGFLGSPIYTFRKWLVDREMEKREDLLTTKNIIELRLLELRNIEAGNDNNVTIQKQIEYYEDLLESIDYKIAKIEKVDD